MNRVVTTAIARWSVAHAGVSFAAIVASAVTGSRLPSTIAGFVSLTVFALWQGRPGLANLLTAARLGIVFATSLLLATESWAFVLPLLLNLLLDGVDGWLARRRQESSEFGAHFDMETDAFFITVLCVQLVTAHAWLVVALVPASLRYVLVLLRACAPHVPMRERRSTFTRYVFVILAVALLVANSPLPDPIGRIAFALGLVSVCISFAPDFADVFRSFNGRRHASA